MNMQRLLLIAGLTTGLHAAEPDFIFKDQPTDWKMAGPGSFETKGGVATAKGGMGLWWYGKKEYANAYFELQFKTTDAKQNSGVFLRFPAIEGDRQRFYPLTAPPMRDREGRLWFGTFEAAFGFDGSSFDSIGRIRLGRSDDPRDVVGMNVDTAVVENTGERRRAAVILLLRKERNLGQLDDFVDVGWIIKQLHGLRRSRAGRQAEDRQSDAGQAACIANYSHGLPGYLSGITSM